MEEDVLRFFESFKTVDGKPSGSILRNLQDKLQEYGPVTSEVISKLLGASEDVQSALNLLGENLNLSNLNKLKLAKIQDRFDRGDFDDQISGAPSNNGS